MRRAASGNILAGSVRAGFAPARFGLGLGLYGRRGGAARPVMSFNPITDVAGLVAWYDPTDISSVTLVGNAVSQINDKSGNGYHLVQATGVNQPTYVQSFFNGMNIINCGGTQFLGSSVISLTNGAYTVFLAFFMDNATTINGRIFEFGSPGIAGTDPSAYMPCRRNSSINGIVSQAGTSATSHNIALNTFVLFSGYRSISLIDTWMNGADPKVGPAPTAALATISKIAIGTSVTSAGGFGTIYFIGQWIGALVYNGVLSVADRQKIEGWLAWNCKAQAYLDPAHPYRFVPPQQPAPTNSVLPVITSSTTFIEEEATLSVTTGTWTGSPTSYAYQWRRGGVAIAGAISNTYLLVVADRTQNIDCVVTATNAGGSTNATATAVGPVVNRRMLPTDLASLVAWYDPNDSAGLVQAGGFASQLTDLSGNNKHLVQDTGANQPTVVTINSRTALQFSGSAQFMVTATYTALLNNVGYLFALVTTLANAGVTIGRIIAGSNTASNDGASGAFRITRNATAAQINVTGGTTGVTPVIESVTYDQQNLFTAQRNSTTLLAVTKNGAAVVSGVSEAAALGYTRHAIFVNLASSGVVGTTYGAGTVGPIAFYNATLVAADRQKVEGILAWRANVQASLDAAHPYKTNPPRV